jgi:C4-dicarboxylate-specific signal transduction histidine kinase
MANAISRNEPAPLNRAGDCDEETLRSISLLAFARFASGVVHEVNNPLGIALLSAQQALRQLPPTSPAALTGALERVIYGVRRASDAVRTMLRTCAENDETEALNTAIDVRDVLRFTALVMQSVGRRQGCRVSWQLSLEASPVCGNPLELQVLLASLIYESIDAESTFVELQSNATCDAVEILVIDDRELARRTLAEHVPFNADAQDSEMLAAIVEGHAGSLHRFTNEFGGTTTSIRLPRCA